MKYKTGIVACVIIALIPVIIWASTGRRFATRYECQTAICETKSDCVCTEANGCLDGEKQSLEEADLECKSRKVCYSHQDRKFDFKLRGCNTANDCVNDEYKAESDWECRDAKQCVDDMGDYMGNEEAPIRSCFQFGLTPSGLVDGVLPISGAFMGLAALLFVLGRRRES